MGRRLVTDEGWNLFTFTESIEIDAAPEVVWETMSDLESWWLPSNPEHLSLELWDPPPLRLGSRLTIREKVAGVPGEATGTITQFEPGISVTWEAPDASYRLPGLRVRVSEGVTWDLAPGPGRGSTVSATVWASIGRGRTGRTIETLFRWCGGVARDRQHARVELHYLRDRCTD